MDNASFPSGRDPWQAWQDYIRQQESDYKTWQADYQRWIEQERSEQQRSEQQRRDQQQQDEQRRLDAQRQQQQQQRQAEQKRQQQQQRAKQIESDQKHQQAQKQKRQQDISHLERSLYADWQEKIRSQQAPASAPKKGLDRHDFYNIDTARELDAAMRRAADQKVDPANQKDFQKFLDREDKQGIHQTEGKRPLSDRYQELCQRRDEAASLHQRGVPAEMIPQMKLYESGWEQRYRIDQEQQIAQNSLDWVRGQQTNLAQWQQQTQSQSLSPARERLAQIRAANQKTEPTHHPRQQEKSR